MEEIHPDYYKRYPIEVIDMMIAVFGMKRVADYCLINAFKYRMRIGYKDDIEDELKKEQFYLRKYRELSSPPQK